MSNAHQCPTPFHFLFLLISMFSTTEITIWLKVQLSKFFISPHYHFFKCVIVANFKIFSFKFCLKENTKIMILEKKKRSFQNSNLKVMFSSFSLPPTQPSKQPPYTHYPPNINIPYAEGVDTGRCGTRWCKRYFRRLQKTETSGGCLLFLRKPATLPLHSR